MAIETGYRDGTTGRRAWAKIDFNYRAKTEKTAFLAAKRAAIKAGFPILAEGFEDDCVLDWLLAHPGKDWNVVDRECSELGFGKGPATGYWQAMTIDRIDDHRFYVYIGGTID
jgi:hypothetical protein